MIEEEKDGIDFIVESRVERIRQIKNPRNGDYFIETIGLLELATSVCSSCT